jgi:hypothetical protein
MTKCKISKGKTKIKKDVTRKDKYGWKPTGRKYGKGCNRQRGSCLLRIHTKMNITDKVLRQ